MDLVRPTQKHLPSYAAALRRGWSPMSSRPDAREGELGQLEADPQEFLSSLDNREPRGLSITLPDGSTVPQIPGLFRWMWDGEICGRLSLRWQHGTATLPQHCLGHIGYNTVPWKRGLGYATSALRQALPIAREVGLPYVDLTTDIENFASQRVITANGGTFIDEFVKPPSHGGGPALRFRITLDQSGPQ